MQHVLACVCGCGGIVRWSCVQKNFVQITNNVGTNKVWDTLKYSQAGWQAAVYNIDVSVGEVRALWGILGGGEFNPWKEGAERNKGV